MIWIAVWMWLLTLFSGADALTTNAALAHGAHEVNPFLAPVVEHIFIIKIAFLLIALGIALWTERHCRGAGWMVPAAGTCMTVLPVVSNILVMVNNGWI